MQWAEAALAEVSDEGDGGDHGIYRSALDNLALSLPLSLSLLFCCFFQLFLVFPVSFSFFIFLALYLSFLLFLSFRNELSRCGSSLPGHWSCRVHSDS